MNNQNYHTVCVVGLGYIGLPTAAILAARGYQVHGVEINAMARDVINSGRAHVIEPDLDAVVKTAVDSGRLRAHAEPSNADVFMLCVPTPVGEESGADLSYVRNAAASICPFLQAGNLVILESTIPPGTTELVASIVKEKTGLDENKIHFAHAPERVLPGHILREVVENDRIVGGLTDAANVAANAFFSTYVTGKLINCRCRMAEMAKLVENASRDVQIAFANELSIICEQFDLDVLELIEIANHHPRVSILQPGCGVGGHCIAVDPWFIVHMTKNEHGQSRARLMQIAREINNYKPHWVIAKVQAAVAKLGKSYKALIACFGAAYKPDIDDLRESPAKEIADHLKTHNIGNIVVVEPNVKELQGHVLVSQDEAIAKADIILFLVNHQPFRAITLAQLEGKVVIDACGITYRSRF